MGKIVVRVGAGFLFLWGLMLGSAKADEKIVEIVKNAKPAIVLIQTFDANRKLTAQGTGFFIDSKGRLITNHHIIERAYSAKVKTTLGREYPVEGIIAKDKDADIIKLAVSIADANIPYLKLTTSLPLEGQDVVVIGNPLGLEASVSTGIVSAVRDIPVFGKIIQMTAPVSPGSSGSPVLNTKGEVIGVATFILTKGQNLNFTVPSDKILALKETTKALTLKEYAAQTSRIDPNSAESLYQAGLKELWQVNFAAALTYFQKATEKDPQHAGAWFQCGYCYGSVGKWQEALQSFDRALTIKPDFAEAWNNKGVALENLGKFEEELQCCDRAIAIKPDYADAWYNKGVALGNLGKWQEALLCYDRAVTIKSDYAKAWSNKGVALGNLGKSQEALQCFDRAVTIKPDFAEAWYNKGVALYQLNRYMEARQAFQKAADMGHSGARRALDILSKEGH